MVGAWDGFSCLKRMSNVPSPVLKEKHWRFEVSNTDSRHHLPLSLTVRQRSPPDKPLSQDGSLCTLFAVGRYCAHLTKTTN